MLVFCYTEAVRKEQASVMNWCMTVESSAMSGACDEREELGALYRNYDERAS